MRLLFNALLCLLCSDGFCQVKFAEPTIFTAMPSKEKIISVLSVKQRFWDNKNPEKVTYKDSVLSFYDKYNNVIKLVEYTGSDSLVTDITYNRAKQPLLRQYWDTGHKNIGYFEEYEYDKKGNQSVFRAFENGRLKTSSVKTYDKHGNVLSEKHSDGGYIEVTIDYTTLTAVSKNLNNKNAKKQTWHKLYYNKKGQLIKQEFVVDGMARDIIVFLYDEHGYKTMEQGSGKPTIYKNTYDKKGNITSVETYDDNQLTEKINFLITYK